MPQRIRIYGKEAVFSGGAWSCDDDSLLAMLQSLADPRLAKTDDAEREHALYCAGRFGGLILLETGWVPAPHPEPEIRLEDFTGGKPKEKAGGWLSWLRPKKSG